MSRKRSVYSISDELIKKSQESALAAIQIFNNPLITFKSESFIVLMNIAWTYLLHAYYRKEGIEYRYYKQGKKRRKFDKTKHGAYKHWELERCLDDKFCPLDLGIRNNLKFLIGIRHEIEHQMTNKIDDFISAKFQACCINYNKSLKTLFGENNSIDQTIPLALQLFSFDESQINTIKNIPELPSNLINFVSNFEQSLNSKNDPSYSYSVIYTRVNANHENQADKAVRFIDEKSAEGREIQDILVKRTKYTKLNQNKIIEIIKQKGYDKFSSYEHQIFWKKRWKSAQVRNVQATKYGESFNGWGWYKETWLPEVLSYCEKNKEKFKSKT